MHKTLNLKKNVFFLAAALLLLAACNKPPQIHHYQFLAFGTLIDFTVSGVEQTKAEQAFNLIKDDFSYMHKNWHAWEPGSLGRVNQLIATGATFTTSPGLLQLIQEAKTLARASNHLFNPAAGKLISLWGFHGTEAETWQEPKPNDIKKLVSSNPSMDDLVIKGTEITSLNSDVQLDFGGFAKGYGIDIAIQRIKNLGIENAILNAGGDLRVIGSKQKNTPWVIGLRDPFSDDIVATLNINHDESVFTSGVYERNFTTTQQGKEKIRHHILNTRTGYPAEGISSVTVIHSSAAVADAAATALLIADNNEWRDVAQRMGIKHVLRMSDTGHLSMSKSMVKKLRFRDDNALSNATIVTLK
ncbi:MAG: FAD:protein FMN transferase [Gammaproteobacteria bacterium]|nr:FAD:protein FMN transferase [Gammaproteobacteria bacterium]